MEGQYEIYRDGVCVGQAQMYRQGLYCCFSCRCRLNGQERIHLKVQCGQTVTDLGLCVPMGEDFGVETRIPAKRLGAGIPEFFLGDRKKETERKAVPETAEVLKEPAAEQPDEERMTQEFHSENPSEKRIPVEEGKPFDHLQELEGAVLVTEDDRQVIVIPPKAPDQPDSDQIPLPD